MKYALVTGASRGIGRAIAIQLAKDGYCVIINYKQNSQAANETLRLIYEAGGLAELLPFDVVSYEDVNSAMKAWFVSHPDEYIDVLVNNAGIVDDNLFLDMTKEQWHSVIDTSVDGFFHVTKQVLPGMIFARHGRVVNISSISGICGNVGQTNYSASKAALIGASKALALELAPKKITVNAVAPGFIETEMTAGLDNHTVRQYVPMKRMGRPQEVAYLVSFLASDKASYITGQVIGINGGAL